MTSIYTNWFTSVKDEGLSFSPFHLTTLQSYLDGSIPVTDAASQLLDPSQPQRWDYSCYPWEVLLFLAKDHEEAHEDIISLLHAIFDLPPPFNTDEANWTLEKETIFPQVWRDLRDSLEAQYHEVKILSDPMYAKWVNYHAFTGRLISSSLMEPYYWALHLTVEALETKVDDSKPTAKQDGNIAAAGQYFIHAAKDLLHNPFRGAEGTHATSWGKDSQMWQEEQGFSTERLGFWRRRFGQLRVLETLSEGTREAARRAEVGMEKAERQGKKKSGR
ncbi:hypothetical protein P170DRAFT_460807 [Aspergillus steynii IBT 23096]|uniref:Uncharacterized protein n=1 Tax=Aspergillus steynii IBT 23096 TaxID=1392250 RepID=A0A2I2GPI0_9EURO|nr:uncharacterized protein P170DRAFT_460807 [Aspergillus steynii IBT 23096]PLB54763.1 hypothetical protein P170DRAFT_460807 [Aspergillus steynii IBT 23096]